MVNKTPKNVTIYGRLSFPTWTAKEAYDRSQSGQYKAASVDKAQANFQLVLEESQYQKLKDHALNVFLPWCVENEAKGEKRDKLTSAEAKALSKQVKSDDLDGALNTPFRPVSDKTLELAPEAVAVVKCLAAPGQDISLMARVDNESELSVPDPDILQFPVLKPIGQTTHSMYPGCYVIATLSLYAYLNGKHPGFSAGVSTAVFKADGDRFGGGVSLDMDEILAD